ncbi:MAG: SAM-dependent methyltransferase [Lachnospiraceae bacterium]|nr:SAM-dependent methyltransferase [Lachnospiraceae bacterium]
MINLLSKRLTAIGRLVTPGSRLADIGTDHALLPVALIRDGVIPCAIAMDVNEGPLARAREGISRYGLGEKITVRLSDGFGALRPGEADSAVIAGMGGDLMIRILTQGMDIARTLPEIICSPQSEIARVRAFARDSGFRIDAEDMVLEDGKYYQMFRLKKAAYDRECAGNSQADDEMQDVWDHYGPLLIRDRHPVLSGFLEREQKQAETILRALGQGGSGSEERKRQIIAGLERIEKARRAMAGRPEEIGKGEPG